MEKAILTQQELQSNLERFATFYSSQTNKGTYRTTGSPPPPKRWTWHKG